jgi:hypothetical protein
MAVIEIIALSLAALVIFLVIGIFTGLVSDRGIGGRAAPTAASSFGGDTLPMTNVRAIGNYAYVVGDGGLWVLDVSDQAHPTQVGYAAMTSVGSVDVAGNYAFAGGAFFRVVDVSKQMPATD